MGIDRQFVSLESPTQGRAGAGGRPCQGVYHAPSSERPSTAVIANHYNIDFSEHYLAEHLAARGVGFLGWNTRYRGNEAYFLVEHAVVDIGEGVRWLREEAGVETVVLLGNSGGGSLMAAYQSQATEANLRPTMGLKLPEAALDLPAAHLYVSLNAHLGRPDVLTAWMDPSVTDEHDPLSVDPALDMFDPANGPPYNADFVTRYRAAQVARNNRITDWAKGEIVRLSDAGAWDRLFNVDRVWADLRFLDLTLDPSERPVGCYLGDARKANLGPFGIGRTNTLRSWLSMWSLADSQCRAEPHLARIRVPSLVVQSLGDAGVFPSDAQAMFDALGSDDKVLELPPGDHYFQHHGSRDELADLITSWVGSKGA